MSILGINFRHMYQKRGFLFGMLGFCLFAFIMDCTLIEVRRGRGAVYYAPAVIWLFFTGSLVSALVLEVLAKPFAYCMPGHRPVVRKFLLISGVVLAVVWSLKGLGVIMYQRSGFDLAMIASCLSAFWLYTIFYWCGVWLTMRAKNWAVSFAFFPLVMLLNNILYVFDSLEYVIVHYSALAIIAGGVVNYLVWNKLDGCVMAREYCGKLRMGAFDEWNMDKMQRVRKERMAEAPEKKTNKLQIAPSVERYFMRHILRQQPGGTGQFIWGGLYRTCGVAATQYLNEMVRFLMIMVPMICLLCYMPSDTGRIVYIMPGIMFINMNLGVRSTMMPIAGRRQRYWTGFVSGAVTCIATVLMLFVITIWTVPVESYMPAFKLAGHDWTFTAMNIRYLPISLVLIPISLAFGLIFPNKPLWRLAAMMILFQIAFLGIFFMSFNELAVVIGPLHVVIMTIVSWGMFVVVLERTCKKGNLVK